jgi:hypothetical protein
LSQKKLFSLVWYLRKCPNGENYKSRVKGLVIVFFTV